ncbi:MAG: carbohydrate-binding domain-containing protein [Eubacterium sp.]
MNLKKTICVLTAISLLGGVLAGCSQGEQSTGVTEVQTVTVTDQSGEAVTDKSGDAVTVTVTTTAPSTKKGETTQSTQTTSSAGTTATTSAGTSSTAKSTASTTAKKNNNTMANTTAAKTTANNASPSSAKTTAKATTAKATTKAAQTQSTTAPAVPPISINLTKNGNAECSSDNVTIGSGIVQIDKGGDYLITSSTSEWHGQIIIRLKNTEEADIRFENVNISNTSPNIIKIIDASITTDRSFVEAEATTGTDADNELKDEMKQVSKQESAPNVSLSFPTGTTSTFQTSSNSFTGVVYNESKLTIKGNGVVNFESTKNANNVICSTKSMTFKNVTANLSTAAAEATSSLSSAKGIFSYSKVNVESGKLYIRSNGDCIRCDDFNLYGGNVDLKSGAADGIDADDSICIYGGNINSIALEKSCFKVRRVNNQEAIDNKDTTVSPEDGITDKATQTFKINGGVVRGESKNISTVQSSTQPSITCRSVKAAGSTEAKKLIQFKITGSGFEKHSYNKCIKFIYSSSEIDKSKAYTVSASGYESTKVTFTGNIGDARIIANI